MCAGEYTRAGLVSHRQTSGKADDRAFIKIPAAHSGMRRTSKDPVKSCDQICAGFGNHAQTIQEVIITSRRTVAVEG